MIPDSKDVPPDRGVEQAAIEQKGLAKNGGTLTNKINIIAKTNPIYKQAVEFGKILLGISKPGV